MEEDGDGGAEESVVVVVVISPGANARRKSLGIEKQKKSRRGFRRGARGWWLRRKKRRERRERFEECNACNRIDP